jgi:hypothetical protein
MISSSSGLPYYGGGKRERDKEKKKKGPNGKPETRGK